MLAELTWREAGTGFRRGLGRGRREQDSSAPRSEAEREAGKGQEAGQMVQEGIPASAQGPLWAGGERAASPPPTSH